MWGPDDWWVLFLIYFWIAYPVCFFQAWGDYPKDVQGIEVLRFWFGYQSWRPVWKAFVVFPFFFVATILTGTYRFFRDVAVAPPTPERSVDPNPRR